MSKATTSSDGTNDIQTAINAINVVARVEDVVIVLALFIIIIQRLLVHPLLIKMKIGTISALFFY